MKTEKLNEITKNINKNKPTYWLESIERIDWVNSFTKKQFIRLYNGYEIFVKGTLVGSWDCKDFYKENINNKDYDYFTKVFKEYFELQNDEKGYIHWLNIFYESFKNKSDVLQHYENVEMSKRIKREFKKHKKENLFG